jgi:hypothetical protein
MSKQLGFLESHEWVGSFRHPNSSSQITGKLTYRPEAGVRLQGFVPFGKHDGKGDVLHGVLDDGQPCTLYANIDVNKSGFSFNRGVTLHKGTWGVRSCVFGHHFDQTDLFDGLDLQLTNFQDFFVPTGQEDRVPWLGEPTIQVAHDDITVEISQAGNFSFFGLQEAQSLIHSQDPELSDALKKAVAGVYAEHTEKLAFIRKDFHFFLRVRAKNGINLERGKEVIYSLRLLFSLLMFRALMPQHISVLATDSKSGKYHSFPFLCGFGGMNSDTLPRFAERVDFFNLPFNSNSIDLGVAIQNWLQLSSAYELFASKIANDDGWRDRYKTQTEFVLQLAQIEAIGDELNIPYRGRYVATIDRCAGRDVSEDVARLLEIEVNENMGDNLGKRLSDLRGEIAHFSKRKTLLPKYMSALFGVCRLLDVVIASHIVRRLGASESAVSEFINKARS